MAAIGTENSNACMLFILRMLNAQLQRHVHLPESERPRVPLLVDEAHYILAAEPDGLCRVSAARGRAGRGA